jgi:hypothetical protein
MPFRVPAGIASAITLPPLNPMSTTPGGVFRDFNLARGRVLFQIFPVIGDLCQAIGFNVMKGKSQCHVPEAMVVSVGLSISGNVDKLRPGTFFREGVGKTMGKIVTALEEILKGNPPGDRAIVEKEG